MTVTVSPISPSTPTASVASCATAQLALSLGQGQGAAGTAFVPVVLTNKGSVACTLLGYPGVSFLTAGGTQLGQPSTEAPGKRTVVTLAPGGSAYASLGLPETGNYGPGVCQPARARRLRVFPPGQTDPLVIHDSVTICTTKRARTSITVMHSGDGGQQ